MESKQSLVLKVYTAFNNRDIAAALALMKPEVDWPNGMEGGRVHGHDEVRRYWTRQWEQIDPRVEPTELHEGERGEVLVAVHQVVRDLAGTILADQGVRHIYQLEDGLIARMDIEKDVDTSERSSGSVVSGNPGK